MSEARWLPPFYALAERSQRECAVRGCREARVRGISVCPDHEHMWDTRVATDFESWQDFLARALELETNKERGTDQ